jgi:hypothetical protein
MRLAAERLPGMRTELAIAVALAASPALADSTFTCLKETRGVRATKVAALCGEPTSSSEHEEERVVQLDPNELALQQICVQQVVLLHGDLSLCSRTRRISVEEWTYDLGPQNFVRKLRFEDGVLVRVDTGWYGKGD